VYANNILSGKLSERTRILTIDAQLTQDSGPTVASGREEGLDVTLVTGVTYFLLLVLDIDSDDNQCKHDFSAVMMTPTFSTATPLFFQTIFGHDP
jgi:hypothetical protein